MAAAKAHNNDNGNNKAQIGMKANAQNWRVYKKTDLRDEKLKPKIKKNEERVMKKWRNGLASPCGLSQIERGLGLD